MAVISRLKLITFPPSVPDAYCGLCLFTDIQTAQLWALWGLNSTASTPAFSSKTAHFPVVATKSILIVITNYICECTVFKLCFSQTGLATLSKYKSRFTVLLKQV